MATVRQMFYIISPLIIISIIAIPQKLFLIKWSQIEMLHGISSLLTSIIAMSYHQNILLE